MESVLEIDGLVKRYRGEAAVDHLSLAVRRGEIYGFLGMNGAGKTTTIRMILGLVHPDAGSIRLFGEDVAACPSVLRRVGAMVEFPGFYENLTARENLEIHASLSGVRDAGAIDAALETVGLADDRKKTAGQCSLGMRQRLGLARAILHRPEVVILDEPTNGLDPAGIRDIRQLLARLCREHRITIFMSSHILGEVEQVADRVGVIHRGRLLEEISIADLRKKNRTFVEFGVSDENRSAMLLERHLGITDFEILDGGIIRVFSHIGEQAAINRLLVEKGIEVSRVWQSETGLEEYFLGLTGEKDA